MKNVLLPIDFTESCYNAIDYAISFLKDETCNFYLLNTYNYNIQGLDSIDFLRFSEADYNKPRKESNKSLGIVIEKYTLKNTRENHCFYAISEYGDLIEVIKNTIENLKIDLVLIDGKEDEETNATGSYSKNTKLIIDNVRTCPVMVVPENGFTDKRPSFVLISNFDKKLSREEINKWYPLVRAVRGTVKLMSLTIKDEMSDIQKLNQLDVIMNVKKLSGVELKVECLKDEMDLRQFADANPDKVMCFIDPQPDFWRKWGFVHSHITNLGPLTNTPLIALHN
ncbi:hypothetical protein SCB49_02264 [unidentified eubacterium SCB49]|nr:hypothetical protein SCB49_02264 [unidentified eubacterium SCB49]